MSLDDFYYPISSVRYGLPLALGAFDFLLNAIKKINIEIYGIIEINSIGICIVVHVKYVAIAWVKPKNSEPINTPCGFQLPKITHTRAIYP